MDRKTGLLFLLMFLLLAGCPGREVQCATNNDCPAGTFCINERCTALACGQEGRGCKSPSDCCGSLECVNGICERIPELEGRVKLVAGENSISDAYGVSLATGKAHVVFGQNCEVLGGSTEVELKHGGDASKAEVSVGGIITAGLASAKLDAIVGNSTSSACEVRSKMAIIGVSKKEFYEDFAPPGTTIQIPGSTASFRIKTLAPKNPQGFQWQPFSLSEGESIPGEGIVLSSITGNLDQETCSASESVAIFSTREGTEVSVQEGETVYVSGKLLSVDSFSFFTSDCKPSPKPSVALRFVVSMPCRYLRIATVELLSGESSTTFMVDNEKPYVFSSGEVALDPLGFGGSCIGPNPLLKLNFTQTEKLRMVEGSSGTALNGVNVRLEGLDLLAVGTPCAVKDATARLSLKSSSQDFGSISLKKGTPASFAGFSISLDEIRGEFFPRAGCALETPSFLLTVSSPDGSGGIFGSKVPDGTALFIEIETAREELPIGGYCPPFSSSPLAYSFDKEKREFSFISAKPSGPVRVVEGVIKRISGESEGVISSLFTGASIPFEKDGLRVLGVNKEGDALLDFRGTPLVIAPRGQFSAERNSTEYFQNCTLSVRTIETVRNYGLVKAPA